MSSKARVVVGLAILAMVTLTGGIRPDAQAKAVMLSCMDPGCLDASFGHNGVMEAPHSLSSHVTAVISLSGRW